MPYEYDFDFEINVSGECFDKDFKLSELKKELKEKIEDYLERKTNVANYDIWGFRIEKNFEKLDE